MSLPANLQPLLKRLLLRLLLAAMGSGIALGGLEIFVRWYYPDGAIPAAHMEHSSPERNASVHQDDEAGYLPNLGKGQLYDENGCLPNEYRRDDKKGQRLLFIGDSVTYRARIFKALRQLYGESGYEYWNAGVESFNTRQELVLYRRHNYRIKPDHVILTFHNNDFRATPLAVKENGQFKIYNAGMNINPWLFEHSYLYRWAWPRADDRQLRARQVWESLVEFKALTTSQNVRFSVILLPMFKPLAQWDRAELWSREESLNYFRQLNLRYFDLLPALEAVLAEGHEVTESPGDSFHPNDLVSERFAQELHRQGLLRKP